MISIYKGKTLAGKEDDQGNIHPAPTPPGQQLAEWLKQGVPGLRGVEEGDVISEQPITVPPQDPFFGLALLDHMAELGWQVFKEAPVPRVQASPFRKYLTGYQTKDRGQPCKPGEREDVTGCIPAKKPQAQQQAPDFWQQYQGKKPQEQPQQPQQQKKPDIRPGSYSEMLSQWIERFNKYGGNWDEAKMSPKEIAAWDAAYKNGKTRDMVPKPPGYEKRNRPKPHSVGEKTFYDAVDNYDELKERYLKKGGGTYDENGQLKSITLNTDDWRDLFPEYKGTNAQDVHEASSYLNKKLFAEALITMKGKGNNTLVILAGGGGSGKGSATKGFYDNSDYPIQLDQVSDNLQKLEHKVDEARANGYEAEYVFVDRSPKDAWLGGVVARAINSHKAGELPRTVPLEIALRANIHARKTAAELLRRRPDIPVNVIDNNRGVGKARLITDKAQAIDFLEGQVHEYETLHKELLHETVRLYESGELPENIAIGLVGKRAIQNRRTQPRPTQGADRSRQGAGSRAAGDLGRAGGKDPTSALTASGTKSLLGGYAKAVRRGTCKPGERADLTGCTPASKETPKDPTGKTKGSKPKSSTPLSKEQKEAVRAYKNYWHLQINRGLREGGLREDLKPYVASIQSAMQPLESDIVAYRGIGDQKILNQLIKARSFKDKGFCSTSTDSTIAKSFATSLDLKVPGGVLTAKCLLRIKIPRGTRALLPDKVDNFKEKEVLLDKGVKFKVLGFKMDHLSQGGWTTEVAFLDVEVVS
jgi:hypothetical protein